MSGETGLIHIYTGTGKGKTTAAAGLSVRARGAGMRVLFAQFLKGRPSAEVEPLRSLGIEVRRTDPVTTFIRCMNEEELAQCSTCCLQLFAFAEQAMREGTYDLLVLDEILDVINNGILSEATLYTALQARAKGVEVVLTGRRPGDTLIELADYVSIIEAKKHPYDRGITARVGIEL